MCPVRTGASPVPRIIGAALMAKITGEGNSMKLSRESRPTIAYRVQPQGAALHGPDSEPHRSETSNGELAQGVHVFGSAPELYAVRGWYPMQSVEVVEIECAPGDLVENGDFEGELLKAGRGRIINRKKFRDLDALLAWVKRELGD